MLRTVGRRVPPPPGIRGPVEWGNADRLRELFGDRVSDLRIEPRTFMYRFASPEAFADFFREYYGPTVKAFEAAGAGGEALARDLRDLASSWNRLEESGAVALPAAYLESVGVRG